MCSFFKLNFSLFALYVIGRPRNSLQIWKRKARVLENFSKIFIKITRIFDPDNVDCELIDRVEDETTTI